MNQVIDTTGKFGRTWLHSRAGLSHDHMRCPRKSKSKENGYRSHLQLGQRDQAAMASETKTDNMDTKYIIQGAGSS